jgi:alpha-beta hydrolase superfamily lysophospholipase
VAFRVVGVACAAIALLGGGFAALIGLRSYNREIGEFFPARRPVALSAAAAGLPEVETVAFRDRRGGTLRGWFVPSRTGAAVVLVHGAGGDRSSLAPEARALVARGIGVLTFDLPGHGESEGEIHWSTGESLALVAALDFLDTQPDLGGQRTGVLGFSLGGVIAARVAASDPRPKAVVLAGTPSNQPDQVKFEYGQWGPLSEWPALMALRSRGMPLDRDQARDVIGAISPRPVLIVTGTADTTVPDFLGHDLFARARDPKELLVIEGGAHGAYDTAPASPYLDRITDFFARTLGVLNQ